MDAKLSCLLKGLIGVIFGGLALIVPASLLAFFLGIFWIILVTGIVLCILIAITSPAEESFFWFICAAGLLLVGIVATLFTDSIALLFIIAIAVLAFYAAYSGILLALTHPRSKYYLVGGVIVASIVLFAVLMQYVPASQTYLMMTIIGTVSFVFGLFALAMGFSLKDNSQVPVPPHVLILKTCKFPVKVPGETAAKEEMVCTTTQDEKPPQ
jgi:uncharacterized membrane protein HdeD (DUF308 family)